MGKIEALVRLRRSSRHLAPKGEAGTAREHSARDSAAGSLRMHSFDTVLSPPKLRPDGRRSCGKEVPVITDATALPGPQSPTFTKFFEAR